MPSVMTLAKGVMIKQSNSAPSAMLPIKSVTPDMFSGFTTIYSTSVTLTAKSQQVAVMNTTSGALSLTLPTAPISGDTVVVVDAKRTFTSFPLTILRTGSLINGSSDDILIDISGKRTELIYIDTAYGWSLNV